MIAETIGIDIDDAFRRLQTFARKDHRGLINTAQSILDGTLDIAYMAT
ncbi:MAG: hypothetical protein ABWZ99_01390 [Ilumatobacteraceae bacterium]